MKEKYCILFVDDEQDLLDGLRSRMRKYRKVWDMQFVSSAKEALDFLTNRRVDIVVSDIRMPQIDGVELLSEVQSTFPQVHRIILSGFAKQDLTLSALPVAHRFFGKPCDLAILEDAIKRSIAFNNEITNNGLRTKYGYVSGLPISRKSYQAIRELFRHDDMDKLKIQQVIQRSPGMTIRVLQVINSPMFGNLNGVFSIDEALSKIDLQLLRTIVHSGYLGSELAEDFSIRDKAIQCCEAYAHCIAKIASELIETKDQQEFVYVVALLHVIGAISLFEVFPDNISSDIEDELCMRVISDISNDGVLVDQKISNSASLLQLWGFPEDLVSSVAGSNLSEYIDDSILNTVLASRILLKRWKAGEEVVGLDMPPQILNAIKKEGFMARLKNLADNLTEQCE